MLDIYNEVLGRDYPFSMEDPGITVTPREVILGDVVLSRQSCLVEAVDRQTELLVLREQLPALSSLARCVDQGWLSIVVGSSGTGKTSVVRTLAQLCGRKLHTLTVNSAMDTTEILGGFEQVILKRVLLKITR